MTSSLHHYDVISHKLLIMISKGTNPNNDKKDRFYQKWYGNVFFGENSLFETVSKIVFLVKNCQKFSNNEKNKR